MQGFIVLNMTGEDALNVINNNFTELYGSVPLPIKLPGQAANFQVAIPANTMITGISLSATAGAPSITIGITAGGTEILPETAIGNSQPIQPVYYAQNAIVLYFTFTQPGSISARVDVIKNYY